MDEQNCGFILCDVRLNGQLVENVELPRACSLGNIVQGLWLDANFRKAGLEYLKTSGDGRQSSPLKNYYGIDPSILHAHGKCIIDLVVYLKTQWRRQGIEGHFPPGKFWNLESLKCNFLDFPGSNEVNSQDHKAT